MHRLRESQVKLELTPEEAALVERSLNVCIDEDEYNDDELMCAVALRRRLAPSHELPALLNQGPRPAGGD
jgi:hypothetical protein